MLILLLPFPLPYDDYLFIYLVIQTIDGGIARSIIDSLLFPFIMFYCDHPSCRSGFFLYQMLDSFSFR